MFFPLAPSSPTAFDVAQSYCAACPVRAECAEAGRAEPFGMSGGVSPAARSRARRAAPGPLEPEPLAELEAVASTGRASSSARSAPKVPRPVRAA